MQTWNFFPSDESARKLFYGCICSALMSRQILVILLPLSLIVAPTRTLWNTPTQDQEPSHVQSFLRFVQLQVTLFCDVLRSHILWPDFSDFLFSFRSAGASPRSHLPELTRRHADESWRKYLRRKTFSHLVGSVSFFVIVVSLLFRKHLPAVCLFILGSVAFSYHLVPFVIFATSLPQFLPEHSPPINNCRDKNYFTRMFCIGIKCCASVQLGYVFAYANSPMEKWCLSLLSSIQNDYYLRRFNTEIVGNIMSICDKLLLRLYFPTNSPAVISWSVRH